MSEIGSLGDLAQLGQIDEAGVERVIADVATRLHGFVVENGGLSALALFVVALLLLRRWFFVILLAMIAPRLGFGLFVWRVRHFLFWAAVVVASVFSLKGH